MIRAHATARMHRAYPRASCTANETQCGNTRNDDFANHGSSCLEKVQVVRHPRPHANSPPGHNYASAYELMHARLLRMFTSAHAVPAAPPGTARPSVQGLRESTGIIAVDGTRSIDAATA
jgi:hypothetical protein